MLRPDGTPWAGETVLAFGEEVAASERRFHALTDASGAFAFDELPTGGYRVARELRLGEGRTIWDLDAAVTLGSGDERTVVLRAHGAVTATVRLRCALAVLPENAVVAWVPQGAPRSRRAALATNGVATLEAVDGGKVMVHAQALQEDGVLLTGYTVVDVAESGPVELVLDLAPAE